MVDKLKPAVREAVERVHRAYFGINVSYSVAHIASEDFEIIRAELLRLAAENARLLATVKFRSEAAEAAHGNWQAELERAEKAESELAALKRRIAESVIWDSGDFVQTGSGATELVGGKRYRLLLDE